MQTTKRNTNVINKTNQMQTTKQNIILQSTKQNQPNKYKQQQDKIKCNQQNKPNANNNNNNDNKIKCDQQNRTKCKRQKIKCKLGDRFGGLPPNISLTFVLVRDISLWFEVGVVVVRK